MTSFGAKQITNIDSLGRNFKSTFKIQGQVYHHIGSMYPMPNENAKFLQIYFIGSNEQQVQERCEIHRITVIREREIINTIQEFLMEKNQLIQLFQKITPQLENDNYMIVIKADKTPTGAHVRRYNAPTVDEVAIVMVGEAFESRDIVIKRRDNVIQKIEDTHRSYDALQYPLIFWEGDDGYHINIKQTNPSTGAELTKKVSAMNYYAYRLMIRSTEDNHILKCRYVYHQYVVDMYAKIESERLRYIRFNQSKLRSDEYIHLRDAINGNVDRSINANDIGNTFILPSSYIGSPRHMQEYIQDAMTFIRHYGTPDLFITFTCNPKWNDIVKLLKHGQQSHDRHDIIARVFKQKLKSLMDLITKYHVYGQTNCWMYSIEWQKRGLPHAHILIWLTNKIRSIDIDNVISAEIPDEDTDPELFEIVKLNMVHGPCGALNMNSPCMINGKCSKSFPKDFTMHTITGIDGYPLYRRRSTENSGKSFTINIHTNEFEVDNRWIVPYSPFLSKTFKAHINVELCSSVKSIKYICKYINKGTDMAVFNIERQDNLNDEISRFQTGRYISTSEAIWRIFSFSMHERDPAVIHLAVHLQNGQRVYFTDQNIAQRAASPPKTTLTEFFNTCQQQNSFTHNLLYSEMPSYYTWDKKKWELRKRGTPVDGHPGIFKSNVLSRIYTIHPNQKECFYLRLLLINVRGPTSFNNLKTVNGHQHETFHAACLALNLLEADLHWDSTLNDAVITSSPNQIRQLFAIIITICSPSNPNELWEKFKNAMTEDILHTYRSIHNDNTIDFLPIIFNDCLIRLEDICMTISNQNLQTLGLPSPSRLANDLINYDLSREQSYNTLDLLEFVQINKPKLIDEQKVIYDRILHAVQAQTGGFFFLDAPGGTGKTFMISLLLAEIRSQGHIALAVASSGIAATLLDGGRTAHSAFKLPLNIQTNENATCNIKKNSNMAKVLQKCRIIIWDECTMAHKHSLEALDRTLKDFKNNTNIFGGTIILLSGDFRQTLPVMPRSTYADEINACLKSSSLWQTVIPMKLTTNMRVLIQNDPSAEFFSKQLLDIGNGIITADQITKEIEFPENFCTIVNSREELITNVYPNILQNYKQIQWFQNRTILAPKNIEVEFLNLKIQDMLDTETMSFKSIDTVIEESEAVNYPTEFLNSINIPGLAPHHLQLKIGSPIILLRNIQSPKLCNGTRLVIKKIYGNVIEATIITGKFVGEHVLIPRIPMIPTDSPIPFKRLQFPIRLAFSITINKSQGQTFNICGIDLESPCFSHGQLYVACSRVGKPSGLYVFAENGKTMNVVHRAALQ